MYTNMIFKYFLTFARGKSESREEEKVLLFAPGWKRKLKNYSSGVPSFNGGFGHEGKSALESRESRGVIGDAAKVENLMA